MKSVIITGGSGLLATNIALQMKNEWRICLLMNNRHVSVPGVDSVRIDLKDTKTFEGLVRQRDTDLIIHTAGLTNVELCEKKPDDSFYANATLAQNVAKVAEATSTRLVHISTDHLYQGDEFLYSETDEPNPINNYGAHKLQGEKFVQESNPSALIVRTNFFGWGTTYRQSFSDFILNKLRAEQELSLFSDVKFTPILVNDLIFLMNTLLESGHSGIFNIASPACISKYEFGLLLADIFELPKNIIREDSIRKRTTLVSRPLNMCLSIEKLEKVLNIKVNTLTSMLHTLKALEADQNTLQIKRL